MLFDLAKTQLQLLISDPDSIRKNAWLQNTTYRDALLALVNALTSDVAISEDYRTVNARTGLLLVDTATGEIQFDPTSETFDSFYDETTVSSPRQITSRQNDQEMYLLADAIEGVQIFSKHLELARTFPHFEPVVLPGPLGVTNYTAPSVAITFSQGPAPTTEYIAIAMPTQHCVRIYNYATGVVVATIGTPGTPGPGGTELNIPTGLAYDAVTSTLYISNQAGQPAGATGPHGFVSAWDLTTIGTPASLGEILFFVTDGSLSRNECYLPTSLDWADGKLWVTNGNGLAGRSDQFAAFSVDPLRCSQCYESAGVRDGYRLQEIKQVRLIFREGVYYAFIANSAYGTVEVFNTSTGRHVATYGFRAVENDELGSRPRFYGEMGTCNGVCPSLETQVGTVESQLIFVASDADNKRAVRINRDAYDLLSTCTFNARTFSSPIELRTWHVEGDVPLEDVQVQYRINTSDTWKPFRSQEVIPSSSSFQFRLLVNLDRGDSLRKYRIFNLTVVGRQA